MKGKVALFGRGKTGSHVKKLCDERGIDCVVFHSDNPVTLEALSDRDIIVSFIPGPVLNDYKEIVLKSGLPVISGSTGHEWGEDLNKALKENNQVWIQGHNFSLGMNIVHQMIKVLAKGPNLFPDSWSGAIHEIHHTKKLDAPSGTALRWGEWFGHETEITSERTGDVVGHHEFTFSVPFETITLTHEAKDRSLFANGALWAAELVLAKKVEPGLTWFEDLALKELKL
jgi:4-hydroxy-tetrahydrodipicolinate reductase